MMLASTPARRRPPAAAVVLAAACLAAPSWPAAALAAEPNATAPLTAAFFAERVRPLLERHCIECHGKDTAEGGLRLDSLTGIAKGGRSGPAIRPTAAEQSLLVQAVRRLDESLSMPPEQPLAKEEVDVLVQWIAGGAPHPDGEIPAITVPAVAAGRGRDFWSFKVPARADPPRVSAAHGGAAAHPIDAFILADLESRGLEPTAVADKPALIRRATFTLIGLPPTPDEIDAFIADESPEAFAKVVDRLLASPHYGEHWARHWLDVVRYADSNGLDENIAHGNAWRYRDWCIRAFNDDVPFDRFLREQIAGDLLAADQTDEPRRAELFVATGFLSLGPKAIAEGDQTKLVMDIIDEQIDTTGRAVLGLSLGCARCHDHKFDPISQADYYALAGIFKSTKTMESLKRLAKWHENVIATAAEQEQFKEHESRIAAGKKGIETFLADTRRQLATATVAGQAAGDGGVAAADAAAPQAELPEEKFPDEAKARLKELRDAQKKLEAGLPTLAAAMGVTDGDVEETRIHVRGSHLMLGEAVSRGVPAALQLDGPLAVPKQGSGRRELADWLADPRHPLTARVLANRLWRWHFGRGIVRSTDNFGLTGELPTNRPLLDWLAVRLVESGWSLKAMHRLILLSQTWQRSSDAATSPTAAACLQADPDNALWWRADVRRLEAESLRDAMLAASGRLDRTMGGSMLHVANRAFLFDHTSKDETRYETGRRSIYLPVIRNHISDALWLFDCTDGAVGLGDRPTSTVASQALYLLNGDFAIGSAEAIAKSLIAAAPHDAETRTLLLFRRLFGRRPTADEIVAVRRSLEKLSAELAATGVAAADGETAAWTAVSQALLVGNEFVMLR
jgi:cytochrome c553